MRPWYNSPIIYIIIIFFFVASPKASIIILAVGAVAYPIYIYIKQEEIKQLESKIKTTSHPEVSDLIYGFIKNYYWQIQNNLNITEEKKKLSELLMLKMNLDVNKEYLLTALDSVIKEYKNNHDFVEFNHKILYNNPKTFQGIINAYIDNYWNDLSNISRLQIILNQKGYTNNSEMIKSKILERIKEIEMRKFENNLLNSKIITINELDHLNGRDFENFLKNLFNNMGYEVTNLRHTQDQGADLIVNKYGEKTVIQAKKYSGNVGNSAVQEVVASMKHYKADKGMVVTTSHFTKSAIELAKSNGIELTDREKLDSLIKKYL